MRSEAATAVLAAALFLAFAAPHAVAQDYPARPITLVVPYAAGGGNDAMARVIADKMGATLGQQIIIENRGGAGGSIATRQVARAAADGYTLGLGGTGTLAVDPTLYPNVGYDPRKDFAPVGLIATSAMVFLVHPQVPAATLRDFIALAKSEPGRINFASAGSGSGMHLGTELLAWMAGISMIHIPYKGSGPALTDLAGGHVTVYLSSLPPAIGLVRDGKVRALAVTGLTRSKAFPDVPTVAEAALPGFEAVLHYGIVAPAGTPRPVVDRLNAAMRTALSSPEVLARLDIDGAEAFPSTPEQYAADIDREETKWSEIVRRSGAKAE
jgi:tripartite-type tricarboxylate transporter receptor subunit TctC